MSPNVYKQWWLEKTGVENRQNSSEFEWWLSPPVYKPVFHVNLGRREIATFCHASGSYIGRFNTFGCRPDRSGSIWQNPAIYSSLKTALSCQIFRHGPPMQEVCNKNIIQLSNCRFSRRVEQACSDQPARRFPNLHIKRRRQRIPRLLPHSQAALVQLRCRRTSNATQLVP